MMYPVQTDWLTETKFISPRLRDDIVPRPRLRDLLRGAIQNHALTLVSAPAGYGKTTLLTSLAAAFPDVCVAWISLDEDDNDPARFLTTLINALQRATPNFGTNLQSLLANLLLTLPQGFVCRPRRLGSVPSDQQETLPLAYAPCLGRQPQTTHHRQRQR